MKRVNRRSDLVRLGKNIKKLRKAKGLTQEGLALKADIDRSYIGGVERGERNLSFLTLASIARSLSCDIAKLTKGIPND